MYDFMASPDTKVGNNDISGKSKRRMYDFKQQVLPYLEIHYPDQKTVLKGLFKNFTLPFLEKVDQIYLPLNGITIFEHIFSHTFSPNIRSATELVMKEALRLKNQYIEEDVPDKTVAKIIGLWGDTLANTSDEMLGKYDSMSNGFRLFSGQQSLLFIDHDRMTFVGNPKDKISPIYKSHTKNRNVEVINLLALQLKETHHLRDSEINNMLNEILNLPYVVIHLGQKATNGLSTFTFRAGDFTTTKVISVGATVQKESSDLSTQFSYRSIGVI